MVEGVVEGGGAPAWFVVMKTVSVLRYRSTTGRFCRYAAAVSLTKINRMLVLYLFYGALPDHVGPKHVTFNPSQILHRC